jgi:hypothetical protein
MALVKIPGTTFVRDTNTMALINTDQSALEEYKLKSKILNTQKLEINNIKSDIDEIRNDVGVIKDLLLQLSTRK